LLLFRFFGRLVLPRYRIAAAARPRFGVAGLAVPHRRATPAASCEAAASPALVVAVRGHGHALAVHTTDSVESSAPKAAY